MIQSLQIRVSRSYTRSRMVRELRLRCVLMRRLYRLGYVLTWALVDYCNGRARLLWRKLRMVMRGRHTCSSKRWLSSTSNRCEVVRDGLWLLETLALLSMLRGFIVILRRRDAKAVLLMIVMSRRGSKRTCLILLTMLMVTTLTSVVWRGVMLAAVCLSIRIRHRHRHWLVCILLPDRKSWRRGTFLALRVARCRVRAHLPSLILVAWVAQRLIARHWRLTKDRLRDLLDWNNGQRGRNSHPPCRFIPSLIVSVSQPRFQYHEPLVDQTPVLLLWLRGQSSLADTSAT